MRGKSLVTMEISGKKVLLAIMHPNVSLVGIEGIDIDEEPPVVEVE